MKILIFDLEIYENDIFDIVKKYIRSIEFYKTNKEDEFLKNLKNKEYQLLIIDVSTPIGDYVFQEATKLNEKYNILVISTNLTYNSELSCNNCSLKYNRKLLLKPLKANDLVNYLQNYDKLSCKYSIASNNIIEILEEVMKQFNYYVYKRDESKIVLIRSNNIKELLNIIDLLNIHNIQYVIENDDINLII
jgi:hypothetical protein